MVEKNIRIGAVTYLNARPLIVALEESDTRVELILDYPSRLADALAEGRLDAAMIPSIEYARRPGYTIVSDACIACDGPVRSVKLYGRVPVEDVRTLALDEGSRTSAALSCILLKERFGLKPALQRLPIGTALAESPADAVLLIGDRGMTHPAGHFEFVWDLGEEWSRWTGMPFVFALWIARPGIERQGLEKTLAAARDAGLRRLDEIARREAPRIGITVESCISYLHDNLKYYFGPKERQGLLHFYTLAEQQGLIPAIPAV
jgi:chorismate dehydratase